MTWIHLVVLVIDTAVMIAGLLVGPEAAGTAFFAISLGLGAYTAGAGRPATKTGLWTEASTYAGTRPWNTLKPGSGISRKKEASWLREQSPIHGPL